MTQEQCALQVKEQVQTRCRTCSPSEQNGMRSRFGLAQGILTGKYKPGEPPPADSRAAAERMSAFMDLGAPNMQPVLERVQRLRPVAEELGLSMAQLALAWVLREENVASAIVGASRPEQLEDNAGASGVELDAETLTRIDEILGDSVMWEPPDSAR